ncbi:MAG: hypothetical protein V4773_11970 [Verrucomicrobiota bacterium]
MNKVEEVAGRLKATEWFRQITQKLTREARDVAARAIARRAIEAMRKPTAAMIARGYGTEDPNICWNGMMTDPEDVWERMIDEALR